MANINGAHSSFTGVKIVIMGVSGCGKSSIGSKLAEQLGLTFFDGDDYHCTENVDKMSQGIPLTDKDRQGWLSSLNNLFQQRAEGVVACSALTPEYRRILRHNNKELLFVYLQGDFDTIWQRHQNRTDHYFKGKTLLENQFATLVEPNASEALIIDIRQNVSEIVADIIQKLSDLNNK
ncbi:carbohydrate kinase, thermoresistant glucokinase family protein [Psychromonas ingrahamii 37]|uniref:Gluconokinase n=1 Tax=Psychromonas ingrahamii (strain DSM 17664 / CCUG 51855 / 37) TaxID=357804 RepID=A1SYS3_PSYIN|nr:gluconokinase [Psychromonas ingrahamii]ABM04638.1 carbohydrate kinase, thermoresistant glucokinase family protein [Psychromonas ingrahamii 37]